MNETAYMFSSVIISSLRWLQERKLSAVTAVWVRKYEELVSERARLEQSLNISQQVLLLLSL